MNPLVRAADQGNLDSFQSLLGESPVSQSELDLSRARACCNGHLEIARLLVERGADPNGQYPTAEEEPDYGPAILASCEFLCFEGVKFLLEQGASPHGNPPESLTRRRAPRSK